MYRRSGELGAAGAGVAAVISRLNRRLFRRLYGVVIAGGVVAVGLEGTTPDEIDGNDSWLVGDVTGDDDEW